MPTLDKYDPKPGLALPEEVWCRIEHTLDLDEPDYGLRSRISRYVELHFLGPTADLPQVQVGALRKRLKRIRSDANRLLRDIEPPGGNNVGDWSWCYAQDLIHNRSERDDLLPYLSKLIARTDEALLIAKKGKWPPGKPYENLIHALAAAYSIATDEEPTLTYNGAKPSEERYSGRYFKFVVSVLDAIGDKYAKPHNNQALGKKIGLALRIRKRVIGA